MSNTIGNAQIDSVLSQIRSMSAQIKAGSKPAGAATPAEATTGAASFGDLLKQGLATVNQTQTKADSMATAFQRGAPGVELADVMIEMQKASVSFRAANEVRNKLVSAYQEIMNMQV